MLYFYLCPPGVDAPSEDTSTVSPTDTMVGDIDMDPTPSTCFLSLDNPDMVGEPSLLSPQVSTGTKSITFTYHGELLMKIPLSNWTHEIEAEFWTDTCINWPHQSGSFELIALSARAGIKDIVEKKSICPKVDSGKAGCYIF